MEKVQEDIRGALDLVHKRIGSDMSFSKHSNAFLFGTENQEGINGVIDYKDKDVYTVASSGDQYLGALYYGANHVELYDINRITYYLTCLKIASIISLDYREFTDFFIPSRTSWLRRSFWSLHTLKKILGYLPKDAALFWDVVMFDVQKYGYGNLICPYSEFALMENVFKGMPFYNNEGEYYKLQSILRKNGYPNFTDCDILHLKDSLSKSYDIIYLSNIIEGLVCDKLREFPYAPYGTENYIEYELAGNIIKSLEPHLNNNGVILLDYSPNRSKTERGDWFFNNDIFKVDEVPCKLPPNVHRDTTAYTDLVLTYRPKKK